MVNAKNNNKNKVIQLSLEKIVRTALVGIAAVSIIGGVAYAGYFPHKLNNSKVTATGTYHGSAYWSVGGVNISHPFTEPKIYVDNHPKCIRSEFADELKVGDQLSEIVYTWGMWEDCDYLKSYTRK